MFEQRMLDDKINKAIKDYQMLEKNSTVVVGLSGGADSIMLTHYLKNTLKLNVIACHVNHNLRGAESVRDMEFSKKICGEWGIECVIHDIDVTGYSRANNLTIEEAGREIRYSFFAEAANKYNADKIATAHTLSDNAETLLLNLLRGTGLKGLCGIPPVRDNIIRPLIYLKRQDIEEYCDFHKLEYATDSTNLEYIYTRNKIRHLVMPELEKVNPQVYSAISKTIRVLSNEQDLLNQMAIQAYEAVDKGEWISADALAKYHAAVRYRVLAMFLDRNKLERSGELIERLDKMVMLSVENTDEKHGKSKINVKGKIFIELRKNQLFISDERLIVEYFEFPLELGDFVAPNGKRYTISLCDAKEINSVKKVYKKLLYILLDYDKIKGQVILRQRKAGDKISLENRTGTKSVKKLFIDDKLTSAQKSRRLVLSDDESVLAVEGYGCDKRVAVDSGTSRCLLVTVDGTG